MKKFLMIAVVALVAAACSKDQSAVKKLDGTWKANSFQISNGGISVELLGTEEGDVEYQTLTFSNCKLKDDEFCDIITKSKFVGEDEFSDAQLYTVTDKGETLQTKDDLSSTTLNTFTITELTNSVLWLESTQVLFDETINVTVKYDKQ